MAAGQGDRDAFSAVFRATYDKVRAIALAVLQDDAQAEEVAQDVLLEVWLKSARFDPSRGSGQTWIAVMARRRAVDRVRQAQQTRVRDTRYQAENGLSESDDVAEIVARRMTFLSARARLEVLTPLQREAVILAFFHGHTYAGVARLLSIPGPTAKTRIRDGLMRLREALSDAA